MEMKEADNGIREELLRLVADDQSHVSFYLGWLLQLLLLMPTEAIDRDLLAPELNLQMTAQLYRSSAAIIVPEREQGVHSALKVILWQQKCDYLRLGLFRVLL